MNEIPSDKGLPRCRNQTVLPKFVNLSCSVPTI